MGVSLKTEQRRSHTTMASATISKSKLLKPILSGRRDQFLFCDFREIGSTKRMLVKALPNTRKLVTRGELM
jgi:hypothetical protein